MARETPPLYQTIRESIREGIASGTYEVGERLPSEAELAQKFGTTRVTVRQALSQLIFEGLVVSHNGRGSFVAAAMPIHSPIDSRHCLTFEEQVALTGRQVTYGACSLALTKASDEVARRLRIDEGSDVFKLERIRLIDGKPVGLELRYIRYEIGRRVTGEMLSSQSVHRFVSEILGEDIPTIVVSITADLATPDIAAKLDVPVNSPLIIRDNSHHAGDGSIKVWGRSLYRGDIRVDYVLGQPLPPTAETGRPLKTPSRRTSGSRAGK